MRENRIRSPLQMHRTQSERNVRINLRIPRRPEVVLMESTASRSSSGRCKQAEQPLRDSTVSSLQAAATTHSQSVKRADEILARQCQLAFSESKYR